MNLFKNIRIRNKIILIIVIIGTLSSLAGNLINYFYELNNTKKSMISDSQMHARLISEYCSLPLEFNYPENARGVLIKLSEINTVSDGILYNSNDSIFAEFHRDPERKILRPIDLKPQGYLLNDNFLHVLQEVKSKRGLEGYIYIRSEINWRSIILRQGVIAVLLTLLMVLIILSLSFYFQKGITDPIIRLASQIQHNTSSSDYKPATGYVGNDEIGQLYNDFNLMIERIETREEEKKQAIDAEKIALAETKRLLILADKSRNALLSAVEDQKMAKDAVVKLNESLEQRVKERTAQLEAANKELETFTYSVSHDLKAPLRGIDGYSKLLIDIYGKELNEEAKTFLATIRGSTRQMNQLIEDLLEYSRLERSLKSLEKIKIKELVNSVFSVYTNELNALNFSFKSEIPDVELIADSKGFIIAFRNIFENAIKFTKQSPDPQIEIKLEEKPSSWVVLVKDNGIGFDMKYHKRIFEIFQRLHRAEDFQGTGIGLAIVSKAMQRMGGRVWAESAPGIGSTFYLEIPKLN